MTGQFSYLILGAGKQGVAAAYDVLKFGRAARLTLADTSLPFVRLAEKRLKKLAGSDIGKNRIRFDCVSIDARNPEKIKQLMKGHDAVLSALPYYLNREVAECAIRCGLHYCDLGGYFDTTREIMKLDSRARAAGVSLITDCGVSPGMCNSLAVCGMEQMDRADDVRIYCGGLPQKPKPPLNYKIVFNLEGVLGNYFGKAYVLRNGQIRLEPSFTGHESIQFGKLGRLEARITGGATSTCPWTFKGLVRNYDYKTLRYPGHYDKVQAMKELGLLEMDAVDVKGQKVVPRDLFVAVAGPKLSFPKDRDLLALRVTVRGKKRGRAAEAVYDVLEYEDPRTGFTAMQRTTGFSAAIVLEMLAQGRIALKGFAPLEKSVPGRAFLQEIRRRGVKVKETVRIK